MESIVLIIMSFFYGGAAGLPLATPPLPSDPLIARAAADECLVHFEMAGIAAPDAASTNLTEQLLADAEVQRFLADAGGQIVGLARKASPAPPAMTDALVTLSRAALTRPVVLSLERFTPPSPQGPPDVAAWLLIRVGDQHDDVSQAVATLAGMALAGVPPHVKTEQTSFLGGSLDQLPTPAGPISWGIVDGSFVLAIGEGTIEGLDKRLGDAGRKTPPWKLDLEKKMPVIRQSTLAYFNAGKVIAMTTAPFQDDTKGMGAMSASGVSTLRTVGAISGMTAEGTSSAVWLGFDGEPTGFFAKPAEGVGTKQFARIPANATSVQTWSLDPSKVLATFLNLADIVDQRMAADCRKGLEDFRQATGLDLDTDLLAVVGVDWTVLSMPTASDAIPDVAVMAGIRDHDRFEKAHARLLQMLQGAIAGDKAPVTLQKISVGSHTLHCLQIARDGPGIAVTPTWCLTDDALLLTLSPESAKKFLPSGTKQTDIGGLAEVKEAMTKGEATFVGVLDPKPMLRNLEALYAFGSPLITGMLRDKGLDIKVPSLPSAAGVLKFSRPSVSVIRHEPDGILMQSTGTIPLGPMASGWTGIGASPGPVGVAAGLLLPAIESAREAARRTAAMSNFRQATLGLLVYESDKRRLPSQAICDKEGKPLLSWRVAILPYIEDGNLYSEFHLDEPWDSDHNKKLLAKMPAVFAKPQATPDERARGLTTMQVLTGPGTCFPKPDTEMVLGAIEDGGSRTAAIVEALPDSAVPWTKPEDLVFNPDKPLAGIGNPGRPGGEFIVSFFDCHVVLLPADTEPAKFKAMVTPAGGEVTAP